MRDFDTVSGAKGRGGSIESAGAIVADGAVIVNSGYLFGGRMPGNVLLVFAVPARPAGHERARPAAGVVEPDGPCGPAVPVRFLQGDPRSRAALPHAADRVLPGHVVRAVPRSHPQPGPVRERREPDGAARGRHPAGDHRRVPERGVAADDVVLHHRSAPAHARALVPRAAVHRQARARTHADDRRHRARAARRTARPHRGGIRARILAPAADDGDRRPDRRAAHGPRAVQGMVGRDRRALQHDGVAGARDRMRPPRRRDAALLRRPARGAAPRTARRPADGRRACGRRSRSCISTCASSSQILSIDLLASGNETTTAAITSGLKLLLEDPAALDGSPARPAPVAQPRGGSAAARVAGAGHVPARDARHDPGRRRTARG